MTEPTGGPVCVGRVATPLGALVAACRGARLCALEFADAEARIRAHLTLRLPEWSGDIVPEDAGAPPLGPLKAALGRYFAGALDALDSLEIDPGGTPFQRAVWGALRSIPAGETRSYAEVARTIARPTASRAVGAACHANPIALVIPCHRVMGARGTLVGYGGGVERKAWLLAHERAGGTPGRVATPLLPLRPLPPPKPAS